MKQYDYNSRSEEAFRINTGRTTASMFQKQCLLGGSFVVLNRKVQKYMTDLMYRCRRTPGIELKGKKSYI